MSKLRNTLTSRKFWTLISAVVGIIVTGFSVDPYPVTEVISGIVALGLGYMGTTAWEDNAERKSNAEVQKAAIESASGASGDVNVEVNSPDA